MSDWMDGWDGWDGWLSYTAVTPRASLKSDAKKRKDDCVVQPLKAGPAKSRHSLVNTATRLAGSAPAFNHRWELKLQFFYKVILSLFQPVQNNQKDNEILLSLNPSMTQAKLLHKHTKAPGSLEN